jgi:hypothetical protein
MMSWTVACFCGNVYTAPPDRCDVCGCSIGGADSGDLATKPAVDGGEAHGLAAAGGHPAARSSADYQEVRVTGPRSSVHLL